MKRRVRKIVNFFAFNLLFFALYLNFIHKDKTQQPFTGETAQVKQADAFSGTVMLETPATEVKTGHAEKARSQRTAATQSIN